MGHAVEVHLLEPTALPLLLLLLNLCDIAESDNLVLILAPESRRLDLDLLLVANDFKHADLIKLLRAFLKLSALRVDLADLLVKSVDHLSEGEVLALEALLLFFCCGKVLDADV